MSEVYISLADTDDGETLVAISKRAFDSDIEVGAPGPGGPTGYDSLEHHIHDMNNENIDYWKVLLDGQIVGGTRVFKVSKQHCEIFHVFVDPEYHRRGIGSRSIGLIMAQYPDVLRWTLDTPEWNRRTRNFYEKLGFRQRGIFRWFQDFELIAFELITSPEFHEDIKRIAELRDGDKQCIVEGTIVQKHESRRVYSEKTERHHAVCEVILEDDSGNIRLTLLDDMIRQVKTGEQIKIEGVSVSSYNDELVLSVSRYGRLLIVLSD